jgi:hypothetical protein
MLSTNPENAARSSTERGARTTHKHTYTADNAQQRDWETEEEQLLKEWAEKAMCFKWLHVRMHKRYRKLNMRVTIPVIVLSTVTGTANFAQGRVPEEYRDLCPMIIGSLNIIVGVISTISQYFKIAEINEGHRVASLAWDKFARNIRIQLAKQRANRENVGILMKYAKDEYDRLIEVSPTISDEVIALFSKRVTWADDENESESAGGGVNEGALQTLHKKGHRFSVKHAHPDICDNFTPIIIFDTARTESAQCLEHMHIEMKHTKEEMNDESAE